MLLLLQKKELIKFMNFSLINKSFLILLCFFLFNSCSTKTVYENLNIKTYEIPIVEAFEKNNIILTSNEYSKINYEKKLTLKELKISNFFNNVIIKNNRIFSLTEDMRLLELNITTGELISSKRIEISTIDNDIIISFHYIDNSFIISFKSGLIIRFNKNGQIIWKFEKNKILNVPLVIFREQIISLYVDEILSLNIDDGSQIWSEVYNDLPIYQSKGGQLVNFLNLIFFILPNNNVGSIDLSLGLVNNSVFDEIPLVSSLNNTKDKIHINDNILVYLDEGKYLYSYNIFNNEFIIFKKNINLSSSIIFFNNSLISKEGNYLQAINIHNGKTFWLISNKEISKKSKIIAIRNIDNNIEIFLNNGDVLIINNKKLIEIKNLNVNNINNIIFEKQNIIINTESGKTVIF